jgi:hypothetical protein
MTAFSSSTRARPASSSSCLLWTGPRSSRARSKARSMGSARGRGFAQLAPIARPSSTANMMRRRRAWLSRIKSEVDLSSGLATKLAATRSAPEALGAYQECLAQRIQMAAEDWRRLSDDCQKVMQTMRNRHRTGGRSRAREIRRQPRESGTLPPEERDAVIPPVRAKLFETSSSALPTNIRSR